jgi:MFS family permease
MDTTGAFIGVLAAFLIVGASEANATRLDAGTFQTLVLLALIPGILAVAVIAVGVRDIRPSKSDVEATSGPQLEGRLARLRAEMRQLPAAFWMFVGANIVFALGNSSDAFLALRTQNLGVAVRDLLLMIVAFNATNALISFPAGALSDRFGRKTPIALAWLVYAAAYAGFAVAGSATWAAALWILYGAYYGINEGVGRALVADVAPARLRGTSFGILNAGVAICVLPASVIAGLLWDQVSVPAPFWFGAACAVVAVVLLSFVRPTRETGA